MTASDKKKTGILVVLLIVAGVVWGWTYWSGTEASTPEAAVKGAKGPKVPAVVQTAQIRLDLLENEAAESVGRKNLFQYRQAPAPPKPVETSRIFAPAPITTAPPANPVPYTPPAPQSKAFRYEGFSGGKSGGLLASISEGGTTYKVRVGDCVMGQYCVRRLTDTLIEIEDLQLKSTRTFTRNQ
jgi:hypothetical protein